MPGISRSASGMVRAPEASIISRSILEIVTGDVARDCSRVLSERTTGILLSGSSTAPETELYPSSITDVTNISLFKSMIYNFNVVVCDAYRYTSKV